MFLALFCGHGDDLLLPAVESAASPMPFAPFLKTLTVCAIRIRTDVPLRRRDSPASFNRAAAISHFQRLAVEITEVRQNA